MQYRKIPAGSTSRILQLEVFDSSSTTGGKLTGLTALTSGLTCHYNRAGQAGAATSCALQVPTKGTYASGGFVAVDSTNQPGIYELHIPDAALATGASSVGITLKGAANMVPVYILIELDASVVQTGDAYTRLGAPTGASVSADVAAIANKTTNLPADPADQSAVEAAITAATSPLATSSALSTVDTVVDSILVVVQNILRWFTNKWVVTDLVATLYADDAVTPLYQQTVDDDGTTTTRGAAS